MKNLILSFALIAFIGSVSFANTAVLNSTVNTELSHNEDGDKCKKNCKKKCCAKKEEKKCTKGDKKSCCKAKAEAKKAESTEAK